MAIVLDKSTVTRNFISLQSLVAEYLNRTDLTARIPDFINMAMRRLERKGNWRCMEVRVQSDTVDDYIDLPDNYKETKHLYITVSGSKRRLVRDSYRHMIDTYPDSSPGVPEVFGIMQSDSKIYLRPYCDQVYAYDFLYYAYTQDLTADGDVNWWVTNAWIILLYGALLEAEPYLVNDERILLWKGYFDDYLADMQGHKVSEEFSGGPINGTTSMMIV